MNWRIEATVDELTNADVDVALHTDDDETAEPDRDILKAARAAARGVAKALGSEVLVTLEGHETRDGKGFQPAHVVVTVSRLDPKR